MSVDCKLTIWFLEWRQYWMNSEQAAIGKKEARSWKSFAKLGERLWLTGGAGISPCWRWNSKWERINELGLLLFASKCFWKVSLWINALVLYKLMIKQYRVDIVANAIILNTFFKRLWLETWRDKKTRGRNLLFFNPKWCKKVLFKSRQK